MALLFALMINRDREALIDDASARAEFQALLLAEHVGRLFEAADLALSTIIDETEGMSLQRVQNSRRLHQRFRKLAERLPYVEAFWLHGPQGMLRMTSLAFPAPPMDASGMDFFLVHTENSNSDVFVSNPAVDRGERPTFRLSHRIEDSAGRFRGVVSLTIEIPFFRNFYGRLPLPPGSTVTLLRSPDLIPLVQQPPPRPDDPPFQAPDIFRRALEHSPESGLFHGTSTFGQQENAFAYRAVPGFPLYVKVGIPLAGLRAEWLKLIRVRLVEAVAAVAALALLTWQGLRQARRQRVFQRVLAERVALRTAELEGANRQLETMIQEVHHRVKNNLQVMGSLLTLQMSRVRDPPVRAALAESVGRVHAIGLVHQTLYDAGAVINLPLGHYLRALAGQIGDIYDGLLTGTISVSGANPSVPLETAVPLALIVHEVVANIALHAFPAAKDNRVEISVEDSDGQWRITIADNGVGLPEGFDWNRSARLGLQIVRSLASQIGARISLTSDGGTRFTLTMPAPQG